MKARIKKYITKNKPDIHYLGEAGELVFLGRKDVLGGVYQVIFDNRLMGSGWFYEDELNFRP